VGRTVGRDDQVVLPPDYPIAPGCWGVVANIMEGEALVEVARTRSIPKAGRLISPYPVIVPLKHLRKREGKEGNRFRDAKKHHLVPRNKEQR
jgi:hypothetical protein